MLKMKSNCQITDRDYAILRFLWKWKAVSTTALARKFFSNILPSSAYRRLQLLEAAGYIGSNVVAGRFHEVWELRQKGFKYILPKLGEVTGYKSENHYHDYLATAFHLGEWLTGQPENSQTYSEQQLRRYHPDIWPEWVPRSSLHRPDGYSAFIQNNQKTIVAFETELSAKAQDRYERVGTFYDNQPSIEYIFWLVDGAGTLKALQRGFDKCRLNYALKHQFILLSDFAKSGWMAPFVEGSHNGNCLLNLLIPNGVVQSSNRHPNRDAFALLTSRRRPIDSSNYIVPSFNKKSD